MVQMINLPGYQPSPLMEFGQINQALQLRAQQQAKADAMAMQERQQAEQSRQFNAGHALEQNKDMRAAAKSPYEQAMLEAQAKAQRAHAGLYQAQSQALTARRDEAPAAPPQPVYGRREDGTLYRIDGVEGGVSYDQANGGIDVGVGRFGARGLIPADVPGVVVTPKGASDRFATERARGQAAIESHPDAQRLQKFMEVQERFTLLYGKPRSGFMYNEQGYEVPKGPLTSAASAAEQKEKGIKFAKSELEAAQKTLLSSNGLGRAVAAGLKDMGPGGRLMNSVTGLEDNAEAFGKVKGAVLQTVYALSGKQTTNKEMDNFLDQFMPLAGESAQLINSKMNRLNAFLTTLESNTRRGMVYEDAERAALRGGGAGPAAAQPQASPGVKKYGNKYQGLE